MADNTPIDLSTLSPADRARLEDVIKNGWRLTPATCASKITGGKWKAAKHLQYISSIVATEIAKGDARIIMTMPARHGKSEFLSVHTPVWFLERWPEKYVMNLSYGAELATDFSYKVRAIFEDKDLHHLLTTRLDPKKKQIDRFLTTKGGGVTAAGIGGTITGRGADLMLIDDYIKNAEEALSESANNKIWEWFKSTAYTRLEPGASLIILATRWSQNDLIERCLNEMPQENWIVIRLPALAEENDPLGREPGEALWPERYSRKRLLRIKRGVGSFWWSAMYQQNPKASMAGQDLGDKLQIIPMNEVPPESELDILRAWDLAATQGGGDYTAGPKMAYHRKTNRTIILDMVTFQKSPHNTEKAINEVANLDGSGYTIYMEQEPGSAGVGAIERYTLEVLSGFQVVAEKPTGKIEVRASSFLADVESGSVVAVKAKWNDSLIKELNGFPDGTHDDQISACSLGHKRLQKKKFGGSTWGRNRKDAAGKNIVKTKRAYENSEHTGRQSSVVFGRRRRGY
ncbi:MAG: hypothetical protein COA78_28500 [Blastopirellula sp.]|nr:MAG: hypothetical protein COA78_28500 [Blastopirellula sp.]